MFWVLIDSISIRLQLIDSLASRRLMEAQLPKVNLLDFILISDLEVAGEKEVDAAVAAARAAFEGPWADYSVVSSEKEMESHVSNNAELFSIKSPI